MMLAPLIWRVSNFHPRFSSCRPLTSPQQTAGLFPNKPDSTPPPASWISYIYVVRKSFVNSENLCVSYPFLWTPSTTLSIALLLDLGVLDFSDSGGADRFSVDFCSAAGNHKHRECSHSISFTHGWSHDLHSSDTHWAGSSGWSVWWRHRSALPAQSAWTAPPGTTLLLPPSAPCKQDAHCLLDQTHIPCLFKMTNPPAQTLLKTPDE